MVFEVQCLVNALYDIVVDIAAAAYGWTVSELATWRC